MTRDTKKAEALFNNIVSELSKIGTMKISVPPWGFGKCADMEEMPAADWRARERFYVAHREEFDRIALTLYRFGFHQAKYCGLVPPPITDPDSIMVITYHGHNISYNARSVTITPVSGEKRDINNYDWGRTKLLTI